jgi:hypothetical protein
MPAINTRGYAAYTGMLKVGDLVRGITPEEIRRRHLPISDSGGHVYVYTTDAMLEGRVESVNKDADTRHPGMRRDVLVRILRHRDGIIGRAYWVDHRYFVKIGHDATAL